MTKRILDRLCVKEFWNPLGGLSQDGRESQGVKQSFILCSVSTKTLLKEK